MEMSKITEILTMYVVPYAITIIPVIGIVIKVISSFVKLKKEVLDMKDLKEVKEQMGSILEENKMLKRKLNETMTLIDRVERKD